MSVVRYPKRIKSVHVESIDGELCVYDTARQHVHALNHRRRSSGSAVTAGRRRPSWPRPSPRSLDRRPEAVVRLTLQELAGAQLLAPTLNEAVPVSRRRPAPRGVAAAAIPAIYSIVAPTPAAAQSRGSDADERLAESGNPGTTVGVTLIGTNFVVGATAVVAAGGGVVVNNIVVGSTTSLTANFVIDPAAAAGPRTVTVTTIGGTSNGLTFTINRCATDPRPSTLRAARRPLRSRLAS